MVLGDRQTSKIEHFSPLKRFLQWFGSYMVRQMSQTKVPDSVSGFRAYSKEALLRLNVTSTFSYAVDTLIQAGSKGLHVSYIPIETNAPTRPSRLFSSMWQHVFKTTGILLRVYVMYHPIRVFFRFGLLFLFMGMMGIGRFLYFYIQHPVGTGKIQSLVLAGVCVVIAVQFFAL